MLSGLSHMRLRLRLIGRALTGRVKPYRFGRPHLSLSGLLEQAFKQTHERLQKLLMAARDKLERIEHNEDVPPVIAEIEQFLGVLREVL